MSDALIDRKAIEDLVRAALSELGTGTSTGTAVPRGSAGWGMTREAAERGASLNPGTATATGTVTLEDDRRSGVAMPVDAAALRDMLAVQPARIAVGRAGTRYRTATLLRFRADHAAARDAVQAEVDPALIAKLGMIEVSTRAEDKRHFLLRPDAGRALADESRAIISTQLPKSPRVQLIYGDGLSAAAIMEHLPSFHAALVSELGKLDITPGPAVFVRRSRVKVMDEIARLVAAESAVFVCGERPGLGFADSLSAYYIYKPGEGATDANREVLSNINPRGMPPAEAAKLVAQAVQRMLREQRSGVILG